jgi:hypothetical protein
VGLHDSDLAAVTADDTHLGYANTPPHTVVVCYACRATPGSLISTWSWDDLSSCYGRLR